MGFLKKVKQEEKKESIKIEECVAEFKKIVNSVGRIFGMAIVPINTKYGLEVEIQILQKKNIEDIKKEIEKWKLDIFNEKITVEVEVPGTPHDLEEGHSESLAKKF